MKKCFLLLAMSVSMGFAEEVAEKPKVDLLENWWLKSSFEHPKSEKILSHFELSGMISQTEGNYKSDSIRINGKVNLRKNQTTLNLSSLNSNTERAINQDPANEFILKDEEKKYYLSLKYDLSSRLYLIVGGFTEKDSIMSVENREAYYAGVGGHVIQTKKHQLKSFVALGRDNIEYYKANTTQAISDGFKAIAPNGEASVVYLNESYHWVMSDSFSFDQSLTYFFEDVENRDNGTFMVALNYNFNKNVALSLKHDIKYSQVLGGAIQALDPYNISETDKATTLNLSFNF